MRQKKFLLVKISSSANSISAFLCKSYFSWKKNLGPNYLIFCAVKCFNITWKQRSIQSLVKYLKSSFLRNWLTTFSGFEYISVKGLSIFIYVMFHFGSSFISDKRWWDEKEKFVISVVSNLRTFKFTGWSFKEIYHEYWNDLILNDLQL